MKENDSSIEERILKIFRELPIHRQEQILDFVEFLVWREQKRNADNNEVGKSLAKQ